MRFTYATQMPMLHVQLTDNFADWLSGLKDRDARSRILVRIKRFQQGNLGDVKSVGDGLIEARLTYGPGYRLYFIQRGDEVVIMLGGGMKRTQSSDIARAKILAKEF
jgi:putative addiction module killer protein